MLDSWRTTIYGEHLQIASGSILLHSFVGQAAAGGERQRRRRSHCGIHSGFVATGVVCSGYLKEQMHLHSISLEMACARGGGILEECVLKCVVLHARQIQTILEPQ